MAEIPLERTALLDSVDHHGVEPGSDVEEERPAVCHPDAGEPSRPCRQRFEQRAGRLDRVVRVADGPGEYVRRPAGQWCDRAVLAEHAVRDLIDGSVASQRHHDIGPGPGRAVGESDGLAGPRRLRDLQIVVG